MKEIMIWSSPTCKPCMEAKQFLTKYGIEFKTLNITDKAAKENNCKTLPTIKCIDMDEDKIVTHSGWSQAIGQKILNWMSK